MALSLCHDEFNLKTMAAIILFSFGEAGCNKMSRTFKHSKDGGYSGAEVEGSMSVDRRFESKRKKKRDKKFREQRKRDFTLDV